MAFMVPLVKNHYDIYARNNPADHPSNPGKSTGGLVHDPHSNSLFLSATSLGKSGAPVKKQYRIILTGGQVVNGAGGGNKKKVPVNSNGVNSSKSGYYRMPSASISLPVNNRGGPRGATSQNGGGAARRSSKSSSEAGAGTGTRSTPTSPDRSSSGSGSPPKFPESRPPPASICQPMSGSFRRSNVRSPPGGRVYSYSVSIPEYVPEENEEKKVKESLNSILAGEEDKENFQEDQLLSIFATSAPGGTGALEEASLVSSKPKKIKKPFIQKSASLSNSSSSPIEIEITSSTKPPLHSTNPSSTSPPLSPTPSTPANNREYIELLRKFILHLKMLKIGSGNNNPKQSSKSKQNSIKSTKSNGSCGDKKSLSAAAAVVVEGSEVSLTVEDSTAPKRARKRKDTMEDSKDL